MNLIPEFLSLLHSVQLTRMPLPVLRLSTVFLSFSFTALLSLCSAFFPPTFWLSLAPLLLDCLCSRLSPPPLCCLPLWFICFPRSAFQTKHHVGSQTEELCVCVCVFLHSYLVFLQVTSPDNDLNYTDWLLLLPLLWIYTDTLWYPLCLEMSFMV